MNIQDNNPEEIAIDTLESGIVEADDNLNEVPDILPINQVVVIDDDEGIVLPALPPDEIVEPTPSTTEKIRLYSSPSKKRARVELEIENSGQQCPICLDDWTTSGEHRLCCLKCGHLYGLSCVKRWLDSQSNKTCPTCKKKVGRNDIRYLYATKLIAMDNSELSTLKTELENSIKDKNKINAEYSRCLYNISLLTEENKSLKVQLAALKEKDTFTALKTFNATVKLFKDKSVTVCNEGGCRVMDKNINIDLLVVSAKSQNPLFPGFGLRKIDVASYRASGFIPLHSQHIRDVKFHQQNPWLLTVSVDKTFKVVDCGSHSTIKSFNYTMPLWSCCWHAKDNHVLYIGEQQGSVSKFDMRQMSEPITKLTVENDMSPVISIASTDDQDSDIKQGLIVCKLNSLWYFENSGTNYNINDLPIEGPFVSMSYDNIHKQILVSLRPNSRSLYTRYIVGNMQKLQDVITFNNIHNIQGVSTTQKLLSRSCFLMDKTQYIAAHQESANSVYLWNMNTGAKAVSLPTRNSVIDMCSYQSQHSNYLIALTERKVDFFKFSS